MHNEEAYLDMLRRILDEGAYRKPEDEEGRYELFAQPLRFDLSGNKLPLMTTKKVFFKSPAWAMPSLTARIRSVRVKGLYKTPASWAFCSSARRC